MSENIEWDKVYLEACALCKAGEKITTSFLQRRFQIGYGRAQGIIIRMRGEGILTDAEQGGGVSE